MNYPVVVITHINDTNEKEQQAFLQSVGAGNNAILFNGETIFDNFYYPDSLYVDLLKKIRDSHINNLMLVRSEGYSYWFYIILITVFIVAISICVYCCRRGNCKSYQLYEDK